LDRGASSADTFQIAYTLIYVLPFYISSTTRPSPQLSRDAPSVIRGRIRLVTASCIVCSLGTFVLLSSVDNGSPLKSLHCMGYFPIGATETLESLALTAILFLGPLFEGGIVEGRWRDWLRLRGLRASISSWMGWRNFVAVCLSCWHQQTPLMFYSRAPSQKKSFSAPRRCPFCFYHKPPTLLSYS
jgi:prenyl protein peptidase